MAGSLTIGEVARRSNVAATTLRYYEEIGVLPAPPRVSGSRRYDVGVFDRLKLIALCKTAGFSLDEIKVLLKDDAPGRPASRALTRAKLAEVDAQMDVLTRARTMLEWGLRCTCPSLDSCTCGIHPPPEFDGHAGIGQGAQVRNPDRPVSRRGGQAPAPR